MPLEVIRYTPDELLHLRESPLIQKPDGLPAIEQWMEPAPDQNQRKGGRTQGVRNDDAAQPGENGQRASLFPNKHFTRHSNTAPEDIVLGPPKMAFASSSRVPKLTDTNDKDEDADARAKDIRDKFFKDREERKNGPLNGRRARDEGEGWTNVRGRKASFSEDADRPPRIGGRFTREADGEEAAPRRNGARGRFEQPWLRDNVEAKEADTGHGSWRDRGNARERDWTRGSNNHNRLEEEPEWMDTTPVKKKDDIGMARFSRGKGGAEWFEDMPKDDKKAHTQEDFQRWKEQMKAGKAADEKENVPEPAPAKDTPTSSKPITPMLLDGKDMFGMWGAAAVRQESPAATEGATAPPKPKLPAKQSKFAKLFSPQEEQQQPQQQQIQPEALFGAANGNNEDKEGFQRILQMLGNTSIHTQSPSQGSAPQSRKPSLFSPVETRSPDRDTVHVQPQPTRHHILRSREEKAGFIESVLAPRGTPTEFKGPQGVFGPFSPAGEPGPEQLRQEPMRQEPRPESIRSPEERMHQATPSSNGMGSFGIQGLMSSQPPPHAAQLSRDREFLLNLMTQPQRNTPPQPTQARPPPPPELFTNFMESKAMPPRANPPPGLFDDRQFPENDVRYQPQPQRRMPENPEIENAMRRAGRFNLPVHPGLDDPAIAGLQRRGTADAGIPRGQLNNMGIPHQGPPDQMWSMKPPGLQQPQDRPPVSSMAPPPGFPAANRGPPGFGGPNMPPFSAGNTPLGHPGMRGPPVQGPPSAGPGPSPMFSPPGHGGPPHGYFGPPQGPPPPPGFGGPGPGPMGMNGPGAHHDQVQQMLGLRGGSIGGPPPGFGGPGAMGMLARGPGGPVGPGLNGMDFFENQRRGSHVQGPFGP
ncbi:uncharacterized protein BKCO1_1000469 [Diplodia corticola]|uniref:Uncharacterized protein n=1 Tax=Diplodia corticola TaxID=236234 RepID=A0A1J9RIM3_9PEZI|nr:uncharacterized protein BKCO1_1000469 [Diplodia corticola]OJD40496.1 hypothetical protein BKCO1_1000469 [Diplodia corticola]